MIDREYRREHVRRVAVFTNVRSLNVRRVLAGGVSSVMAAHAVAGYVDVIEIRRQPGNGAVAVVAIIATGNVRRVLAGRSDPIMAGAATAENLGVIDNHDGHKDVRAVAVLTDVGRLYVRHVLAYGFRTIMAIDAVSCDRGMVECRRQPSRCRVAVVAGVTAWNVCRLLADGSDAIMARAASPDDLCVIHRHHGCEHIRRMAVLADIRGLDVCRIFAGRVGAIVTTNTVARDVDVIEIRGQPPGCAVTIIARFAAGDVRSVFADRDDAIMTGAAGTYNLAVINGHYRCEHIRRVAILTDI